MTKFDSEIQLFANRKRLISRHFDWRQLNPMHALTMHGNCESLRCWVCLRAANRLPTQLFSRRFQSAQQFGRREGTLHCFHDFDSEQIEAIRSLSDRIVQKLSLCFLLLKFLRFCILMHHGFACPTNVML